MNLLLVEDEEMFRKTLKSLIMSEFSLARISEAGSGAQVLFKVRTDRPDLIFMDIHLPGENGLALTRKIKALHRDIVIVVLTNHDLPEYRDAAMQAGADHFLVKGSASARELIEVVRSVFSRNRHGSALDPSESPAGRP